MIDTPEDRVAKIAEALRQDGYLVPVDVLGRVLSIGTMQRRLEEKRRDGASEARGIARGLRAAMDIARQAYTGDADGRSIADEIAALIPADPTDQREGD